MIDSRSGINTPLPLRLIPGDKIYWITGLYDEGSKYSMRKKTDI